jgi:hypothetical protein
MTIKQQSQAKGDKKTRKAKSLAAATKWELKMHARREEFSRSWDVPRPIVKIMISLIGAGLSPRIRGTSLGVQTNALTTQLQGGSGISRQPPGAPSLFFSTNSSGYFWSSSLKYRRTSQQKAPLVYLASACKRYSIGCSLTMAQN